MDNSIENYYKKFANNLFKVALLMVVVRVFVEKGALNLVSLEIVSYKDLISFAILMLIYAFYIIGGLLTFKKPSHKYFYLLALNISVYFLYFAYYTNGFNESFTYVENSQNYSIYSTIFTVITVACTLGIFKEHFTKRP